VVDARPTRSHWSTPRSPLQSARKERSHEGRSRRRMAGPERTAVRIRTVVPALAIASSLLAAQERSPRQVEWLHYGGDPGGTKFSSLSDVNTANVCRLPGAWQWKHWETPLDAFGTTPGFFESTPLMADGVLYVTTPYNSIAALDADTGKERWRSDGEAHTRGQTLSGSGWKLRGTAYWRNGNDLRLFLNSRHRLFALDARTGKPIHSFGANGGVSLAH